jgi:hypothetical protein
MGIKKDKLLRLGQKLLPLKAKQLLIKHHIIKGVDNVRSLIYKDDDVLEFWLPEFHTDGLEKPFKHIMKLYDMYLKDDPNWHFIYEGHYALIRCSYKYVPDLMEYFNKQDIEYKYPAGWQEGTHVTSTYKSIYKEIFHWTSVLAIQMAKNEEENFHIGIAADRMVHVFLLQAIYLAELNGELDRYRNRGLDIMYWEASHMADITQYRTYHIGTIAGHNALKAHLDKLREEKESEECLDTD